MAFIGSVRSFIPEVPSAHTYHSFETAKRFATSEEAHEAVMQELEARRKSILIESLQPGKGYLAEHLHKLKGAVFSTEVGRYVVFVTPWGFLHRAFKGWVTNEGTTAKPIEQESGRTAQFFLHDVPYTYDAHFAKCVPVELAQSYIEQFNKFYQTVGTPTATISTLSYVEVITLSE